VLEELRLSSLGVIDTTVLELSPGFTAITGETGAGKTMLLTGLGLVLGDRADVGSVRAGSPAAEVEARFRVPADGPVASRAGEAGASLDDDELVVGRTIGAEGRGRAFVGGRTVPVAVLAELREHLVAVHGQSDQRGLLRPATQRATLDRFGGAELEALAAGYRRTYRELAAVRDELMEVTTRSRERAREADLLRFGLAEIDAVAPTPGEDVAVRAKVARLAHADELRVAARAAHTALNAAEEDGTDALSLIGAARRALDPLRARDGELDAIANRLAETAYLLSDLAADVASYEQAIDADPAALEASQARLAQLAGLCRKYGDDVDAVLGWAEASRERHAELTGDDERVADLGEQHAALLAELSTSAAALSAARSRAAELLAARSSAELTELAMRDARLVVVVGQRDDAAGLAMPDGRIVAFGPAGVDDVEILLEPHTGATPRSLHRGASGGELSRVMLALEVVLAGSDPVPTFVFDEVDAGVGGAAAVEIGRRLARLARSAQVIVVTHLPQVAAFADRHIVVTKSDDGAVTKATVHAVDADDRLHELTRMLAGLPDSEHGKSHARELLAAAGAAKGTVEG
jgi:DNA repair protein RecN (Recombination protein N)